MKIAFYLDHNEDIDPVNVVSGASASSGSLASVGVFQVLAESHDITVFHRLRESSASTVIGKAIWTYASHFSEVANALCYASRINQPYDVLIIRNHVELDMCLNSISDMKISVVLMLNNELPPKHLKRLISGQVTKFVVRSIISRDYYLWFRVGKRLELVEHSIPFNFSNLIAATETRRGKVVWIGATREAKGFHHLLNAWPFVIDKFPSAQLHVFGSVKLHVPDAPVGATGALHPDFEEKYFDPLILKLGHSSSIKFYGNTSRDQIASHLNTAAVGVVNPNVKGSIETFCISAVELQSAGCPCVGGGAGGLLETIDHERSGILVFNQRPEALADAIVRILQNSELRAALSRGALNSAARFISLKREATEWDRVLSSIALADMQRDKREIWHRAVSALNCELVSKLAARLHRSLLVLRLRFRGKLRS